MKKPSYSQRVANEIKHYKQIFKHGLFQEVPSIWNEVEKKFGDYIERATRVRGLPEYVARSTKGRKTLKVLSLGSGACGVELLSLAPQLKEQGCTIELTSVDINGEVIGVNTAVAGGAQNIGFAISINDTKGLISSILETGKVQQPYLGVRYMSLTDDRAVELGLNIKRGAYIVPPTEQEPSIIAGSPAEKAGLQTGDVILKVNSIVIDEKTSLAAALSRFKVGERVSLEIWRDNQTSKVGVTLEAVPQD